MNKIGIKLEKDNKVEIWQVELDKLIYVLSKLEDDANLKFESLEQIEKLMSKYHLFNEDFLQAINAIW